jgi:hypothetical protein
VGAFYRWWLHLDELQTTSKDPRLFPLFPKVIDPLIEDVVRFGVTVTLSRQGRFSTLMTGSRPFDDMVLAALVGDGGGDARRVGLLGRPGLLALHARPDRPSPVKRGSFIRQDILCDQVPSHPTGLDPEVPPLPPGMTNREHYASLMTGPLCVACHSQMDDIGDGLENFDAVGAFRVVDNGRMVDSSGVVRNSRTGGDVRFNGLPELGKLLANDGGAQQCIVSKWYQYLRGNPPPLDDAVFSRAMAAFGGSGGGLREGIVAILGATPL